MSHVMQVRGDDPDDKVILIARGVFSEIVEKGLECVAASETAQASLESASSEQILSFESVVEYDGLAAGREVLRVMRAGCASYADELDEGHVNRHSFAEELSLLLDRAEQFLNSVAWNELMTMPMRVCSGSEDVVWIRPSEFDRIIEHGLSRVAASDTARKALQFAGGQLSLEFDSIVEREGVSAGLESLRVMRAGCTAYLGELDEDAINFTEEDRAGVRRYFAEQVTPLLDRAEEYLNSTGA